MRLKSKKAVALEYGQQESPSVIAKGDDELALEIIAEAKKHGILSRKIRSWLLPCRKWDCQKRFLKSCIRQWLSCLLGPIG